MKYKIEELINIEEMKLVFESFTKINGIVTAILDLEGKILISTGWQPICTQFHRINSETKKLCTESDTILAGQLKQGQKYNVYKCKNGLMDVAMPIIVGGNHVGNFFTGQFFTKEPDKEFFRNQAQKYNFNEKEYLSAIDKTPIFNEEQIKTTVEFLVQFTETIGNIGLSNLKYLEQNELLKKTSKELILAKKKAEEKEQIINNQYTELLTTEEEIRASNDELNKLVSELEEKNQELLIASEELIKSELKFSLAFETSPDSVNINTLDGTYIDINNGFTRLTGYSREEVIGVKSSEIEIWAIPKDRENLLQNLKKYGKIENLESLFKCKDGSYKTALMSATIFKMQDVPHILSVTRDISDRKQIEIALKNQNEEFAALNEEYKTANEELFILNKKSEENENKYKEIIELAVDGIIFGSNEGIIIDANSFMLKIIDRKKEEIIGKPINCLFSEDELKENVLRFDLLENGETITSVRNVVRPNGELVPIEMHTKMMPDGTLQSIFRDISERIIAEKKITEEKEKAQQYFDIAGVMLAAINTKGEITRINKKGLEILAYNDASELIGKNWIETCLPENVVQEVKNVFEHQMNGEIDVFDYHENSVLNKRGEELIIGFHNRLLRDQNKQIVGVLFSGEDNTDKIKAQKAVEESEEKFRLAFKTSPDAVAITNLNDGTYVDLSESFTDITGYTYQELIGKSSIEKNIWENPQDRKRFIEKIIKNGNEKNFEAKFRKKDGSIIHGLMSGSIIFINNEAHILTITRDITEIKNTQEKLYTSELKFRSAFENSAVGICLTATNGEFLQVNSRLCDLLGYSDEELLLSSFQKITFPDDLSISNKLVNDSIEERSDTLHFQKRYLRKNGEIVCTEISSSLLRDSENKPLYFITHIVDITNRKKAENEILKLNQELELRVAERTQQFENTNKELESFVYSVSHDLRAPLRSIMGFSEIISKRHKANLNEEGQEYFAYIIEASNNMAKLIEDLLLFSRLAKKSKSFDKFDFKLLLDNVLQNLNQDIIVNNAIIKIPENLPYLYGERSLLIQIFTNIIQNAIKYHKKDIDPEIILSVKEGEENIEIKIRDNGIGISKEYHEKIFNIFQRLHSNEEYPGTGIGLAIVKKAVNTIGANVNLESELGIGSTFILNFPKK